MNTKEECEAFCSTMNSGRENENMAIYQVRKIPNTVDSYEIFVD